MSRPIAADPTEVPFHARLAAIEAKLDALTTILTPRSHRDLTARVGGGMGLLVGWAEISRYCRKAPDTLKRYARREGFPAYRWGRHVYSAPEAITCWLYAREPFRREWQGQRRHPTAVPGLPHRGAG
jgi:hypothetical protein